jgi:hypothetical protein
VTDIEKLAAGLTPNMVRSLTSWCHDKGISWDVDDATRRALVKRDLAVWSGGGNVSLTSLGEQVRAVLAEKKGAA